MALQSMTAYGHGSREASGLTYGCEIRTLNSRYLEVNVRLPRHLLALETDVMNHVKATLKRGKVDVFLDIERPGNSAELPTIDEAAVRHYVEQHAKLRQLIRPEAGLEFAPPTFAEFLRLDGVTRENRVKERGQEAAETHRAPVFAALTAALDHARQARAQEGKALGVAMNELLQDLERGRTAVAQKRDTILGLLQKNYLKRIEAALGLLRTAVPNAPRELPATFDERLLVEVALQSDKADVDEELTRLSTHIKEFARVAESEDAPGRKLDFLCQEMHREVNTMSNKLLQTEVAAHTVEMKQVVERLRQQVQNIE